VLRDAGYDMDLGGQDITACSTRTPTIGARLGRFMRPSTRARVRAAEPTNGEVIETVDAKTLFGKVAQAAWECADPGIQYDDTINDWHTNPETGRITASNPCSST